MPQQLNIQDSGQAASLIRFSARVLPNRAAKPPCLEGPYFEELKATTLSKIYHGTPRWIAVLQAHIDAEFQTLTGFIHRRRTGRANAVVDSNPGGPNLEGHAALAVVLLPNGDSRPAARPVTSPGDGCLVQIMTLVRHTTRPTSLPCSNLSAWPNLAPTCARLFLLERDGRF